MVTLALLVHKASKAMLASLVARVNLVLRVVKAHRVTLVVKAHRAIWATLEAVEIRVSKVPGVTLDPRVSKAHRDRVLRLLVD